PAPAAGAATLAVQLVTVGAAVGPFAFELSDAAPSAAVRQGTATTTAAGTAVDVSGLDDALAPGTYALRQDLTQLPSAPAGRSWKFSNVECDGARVTVASATATATITLDAGSAATCVMTNTFVAAEMTTAPTTSTTTVPDDTRATTTAAEGVAEPEAP